EEIDAYVRQDIQALDVTVSDDEEYVYVCFEGPTSNLPQMQIFDTNSLPGQLNERGYFEPTGINDPYDNFNGVTVNDNYAYVAHGSFGFRVVNVQDVDNPFQVGIWNSAGIYDPGIPTGYSHAYDTAISVEDDSLFAYFAYGADGYNQPSEGGLYRVYIDTSNPDNVIVDERQHWDNDDNDDELRRSSATGVAIDSNYVYVADGVNGLWVLDRYTLAEEGFYDPDLADTPPATRAQRVNLCADKIYVAHERTGLRIFEYGPPKISIDDVTINPEGAPGVDTDAIFTISLSTASNETVSVYYQTEDNTAVSQDSGYDCGEDFQLVNPTQVSFNPGTTTQTIQVTVVGDNVDELPEETFFVNLSNPSGATIDNGQGVGTIVDDDGLPEIYITDSSVVEGDSGPTIMIFEITLSSRTSNIITVDYQTADSTATAGSDEDYNSKSGQLVFNPCQMFNQLSVVVHADEIDEDNEYFVINLSNPINAVFGDNYAVGTIIDDDDLPEVTNVTSSVPDGRYGLGATIDIQVIFSEIITIDASGGTPQLHLAEVDTVANYDSLSDSTLFFTYTVAVGHQTDDLNYTSPDALVLNGAIITDLGGNTADIVLPPVGSPQSLAGNKDIVIDGVRPTVELIESTEGQADTTANPNIRFSVSFSEDVTGFGLEDGDVTVSGTAGAIDGDASVTGSQFTYTVTVYANSLGEGTVCISVADSVAADLAGNPNIG
ncbi:MAG: hypothetical protein GY869_16015, partial [Planctomycetes bacterium]|nr:hypothetical protein [Planctomycetota bacterium]